MTPVFFFMIPPPPRSTLFPYTSSSDLVELGFALMQQGDLDGALAAYGQAIAVNPWEPAAYANRGVAYLRDRKSTRLNSSHTVISYAVFCLKKKRIDAKQRTHHASHFYS